MKVPLTNYSSSFEIDDDLKTVMAVTTHSWYATIDSKGNISGIATSINGEMVYLNKFLMNCPIDMEIDHKDRNRLNNKRDNLRAATRAQNCQNIGKVNGITSKYKGVTYRKLTPGMKRCWRMTIEKNGKRMADKTYLTEVAAAKAYDKMAKELFGEFAYLNFPEES